MKKKKKIRYTLSAPVFDAKSCKAVEGFEDVKLLLLLLLLLLFFISLLLHLFSALSRWRIPKNKIIIVNASA